MVQWLDAGCKGGFLQRWAGEQLESCVTGWRSLWPTSEFIWKETWSHRGPDIGEVSCSLLRASEGQWGAWVSTPTFQHMQQEPIWDTPKALDRTSLISLDNFVSTSSSTLSFIIGLLTYYLATMPGRTPSAQQTRKCWPVILPGPLSVTALKTSLCYTTWSLRNGIAILCKMPSDTFNLVQLIAANNPCHSSLFEIPSPPIRDSKEVSVQ